MEFRKILLAYARPKHDHKVLAVALDLAHPYQGGLTLLHFNVEKTTVFTHGVRSFVRTYNERELQDFVARDNLRNVPVKVKIRTATEGTLVSSMVAEAEGYDLLVMGHDHMNVLSEFIFHSTGERVINRISIPTMVVPV